MVLGIDVGGSTTKIVGVRGSGELIGMMQVEAGDQLTSAFGAFGKFTSKYGLDLSEIRRVHLTGVGAPHLPDNIFRVPTKRVAEFNAIGLGGLRLTGLEEAIIVSMGTGTALVKADKSGIRHLGGSGVGGGTLFGMANKFAGISSFSSIEKMAAQGSLSAVDLRLADISNEPIANLSPETTVANFGNLHDGVGANDIILGLVNMVFENVGMMAVFAALGDSGAKGARSAEEEGGDIVLIGSLSVLSHAGRVFEMLSAMYPVRFHIPENAIYATAVGAAYWGLEKR